MLTALNMLQTLYPPMFGSLGAFFEIGAVIATLVLIILVCGDHSVFRLMVVAAICLMAIPGRFRCMGRSGKRDDGSLDTGRTPCKLMQLHKQWGYAHADRALLQIMALGAPAFSSLVEIPTT